MNENTENLGPDDTFEAALQRHGMEFDAPLTESLRQYAELMWRYNEQLNLTRHTTWDLFVGRDLRDCLQLAHLIQPDEVVLDLGSGNGVPGIPLAILRPDIEVSLAESVGKRAKVLDELVTELNLAVPVYAARGEQLLEDFRFTTVVSRAVGSLLKFCRWVEPHWSSFDRLLLVKGPRWVEERGEARPMVPSRTWTYESSPATRSGRRRSTRNRTMQRPLMPSKKATLPKRPLVAKSHPRPRDWIRGAGYRGTGRGAATVSQGAF